MSQSLATPDRSINRLCVFCGSSTGTDSLFSEAAIELGQLLAHQQISLVYGGGNIGLMGILADAVLKRGGDVIGVIPKALVDRELAHKGITSLRIVHSMHERKAMMADLADAFIAMPGGYGTWDEFCEILTWAQLGIHNKPTGLLNVNGFYDPFLSLIDMAVQKKLIREQHRDQVIVDQHPGSLLEKLKKSHPGSFPKWIKPDEA